MTLPRGRIITLSPYEPRQQLPVTLHSGDMIDITVNWVRFMRSGETPAEVLSAARVTGQGVSITNVSFAGNYVAFTVSGVQGDGDARISIAVSTNRGRTLSRSLLARTVWEDIAIGPVIPEDDVVVPPPVIAITDITSDSAIITITIGDEFRPYLTGITPQFKLQADSDWTALDDIGADAVGYAYTEVLDPGEDYHFRVVAQTIYGTQVNSNVVDGTTSSDGPLPSTMLATAHFANPFISIYTTADWVKIANPASLPSDSSQSLEFSPDQTMLAIANWRNSTDPTLTLYYTADWSRVPNPPDSNIGDAEDVSWSPDGSLLALAHNNEPYVSIWNTSDWSKIDLDELPGGTGVAVDISSNGLMIVGHSGTPRLAIYSTSNWEKLPNPGSLPASNIGAVAFSPDGLLCAVGVVSSPYILIYNTDDWSLRSAPANLPTGFARDVRFSRDGSMLAVAHDSSPFVTIYETATWTKLPNPAVLPGSGCYDVSWNSDDSILALAINVSPYILRYNTADWSRLSNPAQLPTSGARGTAFN